MPFIPTPSPVTPGRAFRRRGADRFRRGAVFAALVLMVGVATLAGTERSVGALSPVLLLAAGGLTGYLVVTLAESFLHQHIQHASRWFRRLQARHPRLLGPFAHARRSHQVVHHSWTYRIDHVTRFASADRHRRVDALLQDPVGRRIRNEEYGTTIKGWSVVFFVAPVVPIFVVIACLTPVMFAAGALLPAVVYPLMSKFVHPYLHMPERVALERAGPVMRRVLRLRPIRRVWGDHWLHHRHWDCNFNLLPGGDWLRGVRREATEAERREMASIGLPALSERSARVPSHGRTAALSAAPDSASTKECRVNPIIKTSTADCRLDQLGVLEITFRPGVRVCLRDARNVTKACLRLGNGVARPALVDFRGARAMSIEAQRYFYGDPRHLRTHCAVAVVTSTRVGRFLAWVLASVLGGSRPVRVTTRPEAVRAWLVGHLRRDPSCGAIRSLRGTRRSRRTAAMGRMRRPGKSTEAVSDPGADPQRRAVNLRELIVRGLPAGAFEPRPWQTLYMVPMVGMAGLLLHALMRHEGPWWTALPMSALLGAVYASLFFYGHHLQHGAMLRSRPLQDVLMMVCTGPLGVSPHLWRVWHGAHHLHTNVLGEDPDNFGAAPSKSAGSVGKLLSRALPGNGRLVRSVTYLLTFFVGQAQSVLWLKARGPAFRRLSRTRASLETVAILGIWGSVAVAAKDNAFWAVAAPWGVANLVTLSHIVTQHMLRPARGSREAIDTTMSLRHPWLLDRLTWFTSHHVEHHLFPTLPYHLLPTVRRLLQRHAGPRYLVASLPRALAGFLLTPRLYDGNDLVDPVTERRVSLRLVEAVLRGERPLRLLLPRRRSCEGRGRRDGHGTDVANTTRPQAEAANAALRRWLLLALWFSVVAGLAGGVLALASPWPPALAVARVALLGYGFFLAQILIHACSHGAFTGFRRLDTAVGVLLSVASFHTFAGWRALHRLHHRHTNDSSRDPTCPRPGESWLSYLLTAYTRMVRFTRSAVYREESGRGGRMTRAPSGRAPSRARQLTRWLCENAEPLLAGILLATFIGVGFSSTGWTGVWVVIAWWIVPWMVGQVLMADFNYRTHLDLPRRRDSSGAYAGEDTRSFTQGLWRVANFLTLGFYLHREHHVRPGLCLWPFGVPLHASRRIGRPKGRVAAGRSEPSSIIPLPGPDTLPSTAGLLPGGRLQTALGALGLRGRRRLPEAEEVLVSCPSGSVLQVLITTPEPEAPLLVLVHGFTGDANAPSMIATARAAHDRGYAVARVNLRNAGGTEHLSRGLFHLLLWEDIGTVIRHLHQRARGSLFLAGFSLGGNLVLNLLARDTGTAALVRAAVAVNPPIDVSLSAETLSRRENRLYMASFLHRLRREVRRKRTLGFSYPDPDQAAPRSVPDYDRRFVLPELGLTDLDAYYDQAGSKPHLARVRTPTLLLATRDDPIVPVSMFEDLRDLPPHVRVALIDRGGHLGFVQVHGCGLRFWAATALLDFLEGFRTGRGQPGARTAVEADRPTSTPPASDAIRFVASKHAVRS